MILRVSRHVETPKRFLRNSQYTVRYYLFSKQVKFWEGFVVC